MTGDLGQSLQLRLYRNLRELEGLRPARGELLSKSSTATIFSTWERLAAWWLHYWKELG